MFNVRIKRFLDTEQIQIFSEPLYSKGSERVDKRRVIEETGEIVPTNRRIIINPFEKVSKGVYVESTYVDDDGRIHHVICDEVYNTYKREVGYIMHDKEEESLRISYSRTKRKIFDMVKSNNWEWFFTLTFNPDKVDSFNFDMVTIKLSKWLNNMRRVCPNMKYVVVPELHESGRWHFHGVFADVENMVFVDSEKRDKKGRIIYNVGSYRLGFSTATKIDDVSKTSSYLTKYITKEMCDVTGGKKRYWRSRNVQLPEVIDLMIENPYSLIEEYKEEITRKSEIEGYVKVTYLDMPIYTTNTNFSKRYGQNPGNKL